MKLTNEEIDAALRCVSENFPDKFLTVNQLQLAFLFINSKIEKYPLKFLSNRLTVNICVKKVKAINQSTTTTVNIKKDDDKIITVTTTVDLTQIILIILACIAVILAASFIVYKKLKRVSCFK